MALIPPVISVLSAAGTTLTVAFTQDPLATDTTFYLLDPLTGAVLLTSAGHTAPTAVIPGLTPTTAYDVVAVSFTNPGMTDLSPPSLSKPLRPDNWDGTLKTIVQLEPVHGALTYDLCGGNPAATLQNSPYPSFVDSQVFATEAEAQAYQYGGQVYIDSTSATGTKIVKRYRTVKAVCLVTGEMANLGAYGGWPEKVVFRHKPYRVQPFVQQALPLFWDAYAYPNYRGQWGTHLICGAVVEVNFFDKLFEFVVPFSAQVELVNLPLVDRSLAVKNT